MRTPMLKCFFTRAGTAAACAILAAFICTPARPQTAAISQPIYPLSQIHRGLHGVAYTVFEGSTPEPIDVEILGVLPNAIGPGEDLILSRLVGTRSEYMGVAAGMSGSPVYIDGKLVGAIGYRIGRFTKQPIAGITPIQQMLEVASITGVDKNTLPETHPTASRGFSSAANWSPAASSTLQPIETPLVFNGFSPEAIDLFKKRIPSLGLTPVSGLGGASPTKTDPAPVVPGSAISAIIVSGDFNMAATCTVTYVDPRKLLACGHPITRFGDISLPMSKAVVVTTIASSLDPMKVITTTETIGSFTEDRAAGILGVFGKTAHMIPITLAIQGIPRPHTYHFAIAEHPRLTSGAMVATLFQAMQDTNGYNEPSTYNLTGEITLDGYLPVRIDEWIAPTSTEPASLTAATTIGQRFDSIFRNPRDLPSIRTVSLRLDSLPGQHSALLVEAHALT
ncbi:MAG: SpoIVB peptidase S55, partial [Acidobacteriaceae bacterium]